jgi:phosphocarrier protein HPr
MTEPKRFCAIARITNKRGLHARASAKIVEASARFSSQITVSKDGNTVNGLSIMGLMMLAASCGTEIEVCAEGADAAEALKAILALAEVKFGEE